MARKPGKQYQSALKQVEASEYQLEEAIPLLKKIKFAKFDEMHSRKEKEEQERKEKEHRDKMI